MPLDFFEEDLAIFIPEHLYIPSKQVEQRLKSGCEFGNEATDVIDVT